MKAVMVYPDPSSEKGISAYSSNLAGSIRRQGGKIDEITFIQGRPFSLFKNLQKLLRYDVVHIQHEYNLLGWFGLPYFILIGLLEAFGKNPPIVTMHTVPSQSQKFRSGKIKTFLRKLLYRVQNRFLGQACGKIIVHASAFGKILVEEYGVPAEKVEVMPHAIIENIKTPQKREARKKLGIRPKEKIYLLIGTMIPDHGHDIIISRADKIGKTILVASNPDAVNDRNTSKIRNFAELNKKIVRDSHFEKFVRFDFGSISNGKWWEYFSASDIVLLPYRGGIGSGIFADAMAMRKPVVASNIPYFREFAKNYRCIRLARDDADFPNAVRDAMKPKNYRQMVRECERYVRENGLTPVAKKYKQLYEIMLNGGRQKLHKN